MCVEPVDVKSTGQHVECHEVTREQDKVWFSPDQLRRVFVRCRATNRKAAGSIPSGVRGFFIDIKSFRSHYGPGVDSASNRNKYQKHFLEGKGGRCLRLTTLTPSSAVVTKSGNLNFLRTLWACPGL